MGPPYSCYWVPPDYEVHMCQYSAYPVGSGMSDMLPGGASGNWDPPGNTCTWGGLGGSCSVDTLLGVPMGYHADGSRFFFGATVTATVGIASIDHTFIIWN